MDKLINLKGKKFGRLTVIERNYTDPGNKKQPVWFCKCDCGKEKLIRGDRLRTGKTKSCGCLKSELSKNRLRLSPGLSNMRALMGNYKKHAKERGYSFELTEEQFKKLTKQDCYYCGVKPNGVSKHPTKFGDYIYNGIDRIDNTKSYTIDNVVPCCKICNYAKKAKTLQEYKDWIKRSYNEIFIHKG